MRLPSRDLGLATVQDEPGSRYQAYVSEYVIKGKVYRTVVPQHDILGAREQSRERYRLEQLQLPKERGDRRRLAKLRRARHRRNTYAA
jgi:hypothetical protein